MNTDKMHKICSYLKILKEKYNYSSQIMEIGEKYTREVVDFFFLKKDQVDLRGPN